LPGFVVSGFVAVGLVVAGFVVSGFVAVGLVVLGFVGFVGIKRTSNNVFVSAPVVFVSAPGGFRFRSSS
jgi:hypothetical protein